MRWGIQPRTPCMLSTHWAANPAAFPGVIILHWLLSGHDLVTFKMHCIYWNINCWVGFFFNEWLSLLETDVKPNETTICSSCCLHKFLKDYWYSFPQKSLKTRHFCFGTNLVIIIQKVILMFPWLKEETKSQSGRDLDSKNHPCEKWATRQNARVTRGLDAQVILPFKFIKHNAVFKHLSSSLFKKQLTVNLGLCCERSALQQYLFPVPSSLQWGPSNTGANWFLPPDSCNQLA